MSRYSQIFVKNNNYLPTLSSPTPWKWDCGHSWPSNPHCICFSGLTEPVRPSPSGNPCGDDEKENFHGYQLNDCWGQWCWAPYCAVLSSLQIEFHLNTFLAPFVYLYRQLGGFLTCNLNITISSNHIGISPPLTDGASRYLEQTFSNILTTLNISFQLGFIFSASALISLVMTVLSLTLGSDICLIFIVFNI